MGRKRFYAVSYPFKALYSHWEDCEEAIKGVSRARFKGFESREAAKDFMLTEGPWDNQRAGGGGGRGGGSRKRMYEEEDGGGGGRRQQGAVKQARRKLETVVISSDGESEGSDVVVLEPRRKNNRRVAAHPSSEEEEEEDEAELLTLAVPASTQSQLQSQSLFLDSELTVAAAASSARAAAAPTAATLYFDGGARGNPGLAGCGAVLYCDVTGAVLWSGSNYLGRHVTNNVAEYQGLLLGLQQARERGVRRLVVKGDSKLVVNQVSGRWRVEKPHLQKLQKQARKLAGGLESCRLEYVPREQNKVADRLANEAMDRMC